MAELDAGGNVAARFVYGTSGICPNYMVKGGVTYHIISDHLGSPRLVVNTSTGAVVQKMEYSEFGEVLTDTAPGFQPFGFAGGLYDTDTKLVRFGARDYDAYSGRWTCKDPIDFEGGDTNLFAYCMNDPVNFIDPNGLEYAPAVNFAWNSFVSNIPFSPDVSRIPDAVGPGSGAAVNPCGGSTPIGFHTPNYDASRSLGELWNDFINNINDWVKIGSRNDPKQPKNGFSFRELWQNKKTGEKIGLHNLQRNGKNPRNHPHIENPNGNYNL